LLRKLTARFQDTLEQVAEFSDFSLQPSDSLVLCPHFEVVLVESKRAGDLAAASPLGLAGGLIGAVRLERQAKSLRDPFLAELTGCFTATGF
jgi:hypothetical protein